MIPPAPITLVLTRDQPATVRRLDRDRALHRLRPGVYARRDEWSALAPWDRYLARVHAVARTWTAPVFCLESAAVVQGLPIFGEPRDIHLLSPDGRTWREGDVIVHGTSDGREVATTEWMLHTAPVETAVDLCRVLPPAFALAVADAALRGLVGQGQTVDLSEHGRSQANRRGLRQLDWVQARATPVAESAGEAVSRAVIEWLGYEQPELQMEFFHEGHNDRSDFYWKRGRTIGESDGYGKYEADDAESSKAHFVQEKKREDRLRRHEGGFVRWDWADAMRWSSLDGKLRAGGLSPIHPVQASMLATLATNARSLPPSSSGRTRGSVPNRRATPPGST